MRHAEPRSDLVLRRGFRDLGLTTLRRTERRDRAVDEAGQRREDRVRIPVVLETQVDDQVAVVETVLDVRRAQHRIHVPHVGEHVVVDVRADVVQVDPVPLHPDLAAVHAVELRVEVDAHAVPALVLLVKIDGSRAAWRTGSAARTPDPGPSGTSSAG